MAIGKEEIQRERNERLALRTVGACFLAPSLYIAYDSIADLAAHRAPKHSLPGILLAYVPLIVMPLLSRAKRKVGDKLRSAAMHADAKQTEFCTYLSAILLVRLLLNSLLGFWWADPAAALAMTPIILHESIRGLQATVCCA